MKNLFDAARCRATATQLAALAPAFDSATFLRLTLADLDSRELMARLRQTSLAFDAALPGDFRAKVAVLHRLAPLIAHNFVGIWPCDFVALRGLSDPAFSLAALRDLTRHGSAEFAVRPFLVQDLPGTLATMLQWARDPDEHVRRLASEASRPRLPWGQRLTALVADPTPAAPILDSLRADPALYVRKSVANHLNDIAKDHPAAVLDRAESWDRTDPRTAWIVRHGTRTLVKQGHPRALALHGATAAPGLVTATLVAAPGRIQLGDTLTLTATLNSAAPAPQTLVIDYVIHYVKASGRATPKVFKWTSLTLAPATPVTLAKRQLIRDFTTRRQHPGIYQVELQINGHRLASTNFTLKP